MKCIGSKNPKLVEIYNPIKQLYKVRFDIVEGENFSTYQEENFVGKPTIDMIRDTIYSYYNLLAKNEIQTGFKYGGTGEESTVWLSTENQFNYKAAYDLAVQTNGFTLPYTIIGGLYDNPNKITFTTLSDFKVFYVAMMNFINTTLEEYRYKKESVDFEKYKELLK
jgi:hypothetical protein